jgi:alpha-tubulin suppressor-like RCC1 family protein
MWNYRVEPEGGPVMGTVREHRRIRLARWILIPLAGMLSVSSLAAPAEASAGPHVVASTLAKVLSVASNNNPDSSGGSSCALLSTGKVDCWGYNGSGQLGSGTTATYSDVPVAVLGITDAKAVASDTYGNSFCAVLSTGHVKCWGDNGDGQLGNGTTTTSYVPVSVKNITTATAVIGGDSGGADGFCALLSTSHVDCWGYGFSGELGNGATTNSDVPVAVHTITNAATLISGFEGFCALLSTSHVDCWGDNSFGELGRATKANYSDVPGAVTGITDATAVASDSIIGSNCAVLSTGHMKCWGEGGDGQLGNGTTANSDVPVAALGITDAKAAASDGDGGSFCAVLSTGHMKCWGFNNYGQLGNGTATGSSVPVSVSNITTAAAVVGGTEYGFCALLSTSHVDCWGFGSYGQLGNGKTASSDVPVAVHVITNAATLISGFLGFCALLSTGHVDCWGYNGSGQLGNGTTTNSDVPVAVLAGS